MSCGPGFVGEEELIKYALEYHDGVVSTVQLQVTPTEADRLLSLFQRGLELRCVTGESVRTFLCQGLGIAQDYVENRISTIFLDGKPLDDLDRSLIGQGSVLALSAAMPGLVGASMRRKGQYALLRCGITGPAPKPPTPPRLGWVRLKLFNLVLEELGLPLLGAGLVIRGETLRELLAPFAPKGPVGCCQEPVVPGAFRLIVALSPSGKNQKDPGAARIQPEVTWVT